MSSATSRSSCSTGSGVGVTFEIGGVTGYTPAVVSFGTVTASGDLLASTTSGDHPDIVNSGVAAAIGVNRWWTITNSSTGFDAYDVVFDFVAADVDPLADSAVFVVARRRWLRLDSADSDRPLGNEHRGRRPDLLSVISSSVIPWPMLGC